MGVAKQRQRNSAAVWLRTTLICWNIHVSVRRSDTAALSNEQARRDSLHIVAGNAQTRHNKWLTVAQLRLNPSFDSSRALSPATLLLNTIVA